jgi:hypothetical protein
MPADAFAPGLPPTEHCITRQKNEGNDQGVVHRDLAIVDLAHRVNLVSAIRRRCQPEAGQRLRA